MIDDQPAMSFICAKPDCSAQLRIQDMDLFSCLFACIFSRRRAASWQYRERRVPAWPRCPWFGDDGSVHRGRRAIKRSCTRQSAGGDRSGADAFHALGTRVFRPQPVRRSAIRLMRAFPGESTMTAPARLAAARDAVPERPMPSACCGGIVRGRFSNALLNSLPAPPAAAARSAAGSHSSQRTPAGRPAAGAPAPACRESPPGRGRSRC